MSARSQEKGHQHAGTRDFDGRTDRSVLTGAGGTERAHRVTRRSTSTITDTGIRRMSNSLLLVALLLLAVTEPLFPVETFGHTVYMVMISVVLIAAVWAVSRHRGLFVSGLALAVPTFIVAWMHHFVHSRWLGTVFFLLAAAFLGFTAVVVLRQALGGDAVTADTVAGAICSISCSA